MALPASVEPSNLLLEDLKKSGLVPKDLDAYVAQEAELAAVGIRAHMYLDNPGVGSPGYVIPYYDMNGIRAPFYRVRLFRPLPKGAKYLQPANTGSWIYFPKAFKATLNSRAKTVVNGYDPCVIICEGEKKAARACNEGFLCVGLGGVYSWRTRMLVLPKGTTLLKNPQEEIIAKISQGGQISPPTSDKRAVLAAGLPGLIDLIRERNMNVIIAFDSDASTNPQVQRAAAELAFELRTHGVPVDHLRQLTLPVAEGSTKVGLDDFLEANGSQALESILHETLAARTAYPRHPDIRALLNGKLDNQITRAEAKQMSLMVLSDMDVGGMRMIERNTNSPYYFDSRSHSLMPVNLLHHHNAPLHESKFGEFLYKSYDISQGDLKLLTWLAAGFTGEQPVLDVNPRSTIALMSGNRLAVQISDGQYIIVSGKGIQVVENGTEGILFRGDQVEALDVDQLTAKYQEQVKWIQNPATKFENLYWPAALKQFKFLKSTDWAVLSTLCYFSPWLLRWSGTQLPVELMVGEPGSGKSSLYSLRLQVLTGRPALRNQPTDIRDWYSSITAQDGLHVIDNVHFATKEIRQRLSDEICRIVTEPEPFVEMRKLFTTADVARMPVRTVFACTAITQPFINADILQRSVIFQLHAVGNDHASDWATTQLHRFGGREAWMAHQMAVLSFFFRAVDSGGWNHAHKSRHRLANFEQLFLAFGKILKLPDLAQINSTLVQVAEDQVSEYDWTMEALKDFAEVHLPVLQKDPRKRVTCNDIAQWAMGKEDYMDNTVVTNARRLSRYFDSHAFMIEKCAGIIPTGDKYANRLTYRLIPVKSL